MVAEEESDGEGALQARQDGRDCVLRRRSAFDLASDEMGDDFGVRLALELAAVGDELLAQRLEVLDDAVVDDRHRPDDVRMGIVDGRSAVGRPARVRDADGAAERLSAQLAREVVELSLGAAAGEVALIDRADAGAVIAAIFEALQAIEQALRNDFLADNSNDPAHAPSRIPNNPAVASIHFGSKLGPLWMYSAEHACAV